MGRKWRLVLRCDAAPAIGFGHLFRSLALAREFSDRDVDVTFAMAAGLDAAAMVERAGYPVQHLEWSAGVDDHAAAGYGGQLDGVVLDVRDDSPRSGLDALRSRGVLVTTIDDPTDRRLSADLAFYPPIPQVGECDWDGFSGTLLVGGEWVVLRREFAEPPVRPARAQPSVLVTMGGSDPAGMTLTAVGAVARMTEPFGLTVVLGPGYGDRTHLEAQLALLRRPVTIVEQPADIRGLMLQADVAMASFGVTAYELAATATPAIYVCLTPDHRRSATWIENRRAGVVLGVHTGREGPDLAAALAALLADPEGCLAMGQAGRACIDGRGAARVADRVIAELTARRRS